MPEQFDGKVDIGQIENPSNIRITLDGDTGDILAGGNGQDGDLILRDTAGNQRIRISAQEGSISFRNGAGDQTIQIIGGVGVPIPVNPAALLSLGSAGLEGRILITDIEGRKVLDLNGQNAELLIGANGNSGRLSVKDNSGKNIFDLDGRTAILELGSGDKPGRLLVFDAGGRDVLNLDGPTALLRIGREDAAGNIIVRDAKGKDVFRFDANSSVLDIGAEENEGDIRVRDNTGATRIHLDGNTGDIKLSGADCAEDFDILESEQIEPGAVLVIDQDGKLRQSTEAYDKRVAGVLSGAGDCRPGIILGKKHSQQNRMPVALTGKVYCKVDAQYGSVGMGDLLTTSPTPGHAMKAGDPLRAFGAVIGKAFRSLHEGRGIIPILVALH